MSELNENIIERALVPFEASEGNIHIKDRYMLYTPMARAGKPGIAAFDPKDFSIKNNIVSLRERVSPSVDVTELGVPPIDMNGIVSYTEIDGSDVVSKLQDGRASVSFEMERNTLRNRITFSADLCRVSSSNDFVLIHNLEELKALDGKSGSFKLANDIDLNGDVFTLSFAGTFDGDGYRISGLKRPLFLPSGYINVTNLTLEVNNDMQMSGALIAECDQPLTVKHCVVSGDLSGISTVSYRGGFIGKISNSPSVVFSDCINRAIVHSSYKTGGFVGSIEQSSVTFVRCINYGHIINNVRSSDNGVGGLVGFGDVGSKVNMTLCQNFGMIEAYCGGDHGVGGLYGGTRWRSGGAEEFYAQKCSNHAVVRMGEGTKGRVGGICGRMNRYGNRYELLYCYNVGDIVNLSQNGSSASGIFGYTNDAPTLVVGCYNAGEVYSAGTVYLIGGHLNANYCESRDNIVHGVDDSGSAIHRTVVFDEFDFIEHILNMTDSPYVLVVGRSYPIISEEKTPVIPRCGIFFMGQVYFNNSILNVLFRIDNRSIYACTLIE